jgi:SagB-type dehydrogenase family enzyme
VPDQTKKVKFPPPRQAGSSLSLERCIARRRSVRYFRNYSLTLNEVGQLLWAAQGLTGSDGGRAVASAGALYPLEVYVLTCNAAAFPAGVYHYLTDRHELDLAAPEFDSGALIHATLGQDWIATASVCFCIAAVFERTTAKYANRGHAYVYLEAGLAAESLILQAVALGLATTMVGAFSDDDVGRVFCLKANEIPLCLVPVGAP